MSGPSIIPQLALDEHEIVYAKAVAVDVLLRGASLWIDGCDPETGHAELVSYLDRFTDRQKVAIVQIVEAVRAAFRYDPTAGGDGA